MQMNFFGGGCHCCLLAIAFSAFGRDLCGQTVAIVAAFWLRMISANFMH